MDIKIHQCIRCLGTLKKTPKGYVCTSDNPICTRTGLITIVAWDKHGLYEIKE